MKKLYRYLLYILPLVLCFSYFPVISLGENETMYFELSLPLIWLVLFDVLGFLMVVLKYRRKILTKIFGSFLWWLFPFFATFSIAWSPNPLRGVLTAGVMWLLFFAVLWFYELRENLDEDFWKIFWRWFFGSALLVCAWCVVQCVLDVCGVPQEATLLCDGCVYAMFGFPRPNGWAIEPQFMGNLLLAPIIVMAYFTIDLHSICNISGASKNQNNRKASFSERSLALTGANLIAACPSDTLRAARPSLKSAGHVAIKFAPLLLFILSTTLFLTMSRGAIYAGAVGVIFLYFFMWARAKKSEKKAVCKNIMKTVGIFVLSFLFALNMQGIFAAVSPTSDTYTDGVAKVLNNLSLGVINIKGTGEAEKTSAPASETVPVENSEALVENSDEEQGKKSEDAIFDGYVEESTDTRVRLFNAALTIWRKDFKTVMVGVGLGGAGQALYDNGFSPAPREIVQNEYASLLLETGIIGVSLLVFAMVMIIRLVLKNPLAGMILALMVAYGVSLCFFSGLPNALHIILMPGLLYCIKKSS